MNAGEIFSVRLVEDKPASGQWHCGFAFALCLAGCFWLVMIGGFWALFWEPFNVAR
jgi:hypothetical protein